MDDEGEDEERGDDEAEDALDGGSDTCSCRTRPARMAYRRRCCCCCCWTIINNRTLKPTTTTDIALRRLDRRFQQTANIVDIAFSGSVVVVVGVVVVVVLAAVVVVFWVGCARKCVAWLCGQTQLDVMMTRMALRHKLAFCGQTFHGR